MTTLTDWLDQAQARADAATEGPWRWRNTQEVYLMGDRSRVVMAFERMGMQGAQPSFRREDGLLYPAGKENINSLPDAAFIAASRTDLPAAIAALRAVLDLIDDAEAAENGSPARTFEGHPFPATIYATRITDAIATALGVQP